MSALTSSARTKTTGIVTSTMETEIVLLGEIWIVSVGLPVGRIDPVVFPLGLIKSSFIGDPVPGTPAIA